MVQSTDIASSSVPDLRARQLVFKLLIVVGVLAIARHRRRRRVDPERR